MILLQAFENEESAQLVMELEKIQNELVPILPMINKKKGRNKDEILAQMQMKQLLKQCREQLNDGVNDLLNTTGATAIQKLVDKRIVSIYDYSYNGFSLDELTGGFFDAGGRDQEFQIYVENSEEDLQDQTRAKLKWGRPLRGPSPFCGPREGGQARPCSGPGGG